MCGLIALIAFTPLFVHADEGYALSVSHELFYTIFTYVPPPPPPPPPPKPVVLNKTTVLQNPSYQYLASAFAETPALLEIARCESGYKQYKNGTVLRGVVNAKDVGLLQINEYYHLNDARKLGFNIHTVEGNIAYGKYLYRTQGASPWQASASCHGYY